MNDLVELQKLQIEALQKELEKKSTKLKKAMDLIGTLYEWMKHEAEATKQTNH